MVEIVKSITWLKAELVTAHPPFVVSLSVLLIFADCLRFCRSKVAQSGSCSFVRCVAGAAPLLSLLLLDSAQHKHRHPALPMKHPSLSRWAHLR
jgi:hypothetical protein